MDLGHEIIRQQLFFRKELRERVYWFIKLRWAAGIAGMAGIAAGYSLGLEMDYGPLFDVVLFVIVYNIIFLIAGRRLESQRAGDVWPFELFAHTQISLDLLSLYLLIYFSGGLASPLIVFTLFHVILAGILLSPTSCHIYSGLIIAALLVLFGLHRYTVLPPVDARITGLIVLEPTASLFGMIPLIIFAATVAIADFLITSVKTALQFKGRELMRISRELDISNTKLTSLYEMIKEVDGHTSLQELMNSATSNAAKIMGVKACSVKMLDHESNCLRFASTYGLSGDYLSKDCIRLDKSEINRRIIDGSLYSIGRVNEESDFQYPEDVRKEGIASMLCLPLKVQDKTLGVFCVYSREPDYFSEEDARFFSLVTDLTAMSIENLGREMAKNWFLNKAAHQLRSPLSAILSMLQVISRGYLGPVSDKIQETVVRSEKRISILQGVINDLLKLASERQHAGPPALQPVQAGEIVNSLANLYRGQAVEKGINIAFEVEEKVHDVMARDELIDDLFSNLISNAIKYTPAGGKVNVRLHNEGDDTVVFEVSDTGIGIPEEDRPRLFTDFFRAEKARDMVEEGTGLGLVIVKEISDRLGGRIHVESEVGKGALFTCKLPTARPTS